MATSRSSLFLILSLLLLITASHVAEASLRKLKRSQCPVKCKDRCAATSHKKPCMFFCIKCCSKCLCVPPGVVGNKQMCSCYNNWKTKEGRPKCP